MRKLFLIGLLTLGVLPSFAFDIVCNQANLSHERHDHSPYYTLCLDTETKNPEWVRWSLTSRNVSAKSVKRPKGFISCKSSSKDSDYTNSGYDRGHLCPNTNLNYLEEAAKSTFKFCNISPQLHSFNAGIWSKLEQHTEVLAKQLGTIEIVAGPIFYEKPSYLKKTKVRIPDAFYKIVFFKNKVFKAWVIPSNIEKGFLEDYEVQLDYIESLTGLFFTNLD